MTTMHNPAHPGEILADWIEGAPLGEVADRLGMHRTSLSRIVHGHAGISADVDLRLAAALGTTPGYWMKLQTQFDLARAQAAKRPKVNPLLKWLVAKGQPTEMKRPTVGGRAVIVAKAAKSGARKKVAKA